MNSYFLTFLTFAASLASQRTGSVGYDSSSDGFGKCEIPANTHAKWAAVGPANFQMGECGKCVRVTNPETGAVTFANIVDQCVGCGPNDLILNVPAFSAIANTDKGRIQGQWDFAPCA